MYDKYSDELLDKVCFWMSEELSEKEDYRYLGLIQFRQELETRQDKIEFIKFMWQDIYKPNKINAFFVNRIRFYKNIISK